MSVRLNHEAGQMRERERYIQQMQSILLCVLTVALSVAFAPTVDYSLALSLCANLPIVLTIVHFNGTSSLSLHSIPGAAQPTIVCYYPCLTTHGSRGIE
jgi:hypothetical protein